MVISKLTNASAGLGLCAVLMASSGFTVTGLGEGQAVKVNMGSFAASQLNKDIRPKRDTPLIRAKIYKKIEAAQSDIQEQKFTEGLNKLQALKARADSGKLNSYEVAQLWNLYAFIYFSQEDYPKAIHAYEQLITQEDIPWVLQDSTQYSLAQLYMVSQNPQKALFYIDTWLTSVPNPSPQAYVFKAQVHYELKDLNKAFINLKKGVELADAKGSKVKANWLQLLSYLYYEKKDISNSIRVLERLVALSPKKSFISQLSGMYMSKDRASDQLVLYRGLYEKGLLTKEKELLNLARLYLSIGVPVKAGNILEKSFSQKLIEPTSKNLELLGNAWYRAQELEKSIIWLEKAALLAEDGKIFMRLAGTYLDQERFDDAIKAANKSLELGGIDKEASAHIILGSAHFYQKRYDYSLRSFADVLKMDEGNKFALQWIKYVTSEQKKHLAFKAFLDS